jgi:SAM-dependent methyltransferase
MANWFGLKWFFYKIISAVKKQKQQPALWGIFINPFFIIRRRLSQDLEQYSKNLTGVMLDFGCGRQPYRDLFQVDQYIGVDIEDSGHLSNDKICDVYYDGHKIPFPNKYFDSVLCTEVLEHVFNIEEVMSELNRILRIGGNILITTPFAFGEHEIPYDYARYTSYGMKYIVEKYCYEIVSKKKSCEYIEVVAQLMTIYLYNAIFGERPLVIEKSIRSLGAAIVKLLFIMLIIAPIHFFGLILARILPKNDKLYFNNIILARKIADVEN